MDRAVIGCREDSETMRPTILRLRSFRVRTLMAIVSLAALLLWGGMAATRAYDDSGRSREFATEAQHWREISARRRNNDPKMATFAAECADYYESLSRKYDRAMWHPLRPVAPDPPAPGSTMLKRP